MGLPFVAADDRAVLQIQPLLERAESGSGRADSARAGIAARAIWDRTAGVRVERDRLAHRAHRLHLALRGERLLLLRLLLDAVMVRRPLLEPNLSVGGLSFLGISLFIFLMANVVTGKPEGDRRGRFAAGRSVAESEASKTELTTLRTHGPGFPLVYRCRKFRRSSCWGKEGNEPEAIPRTTLFSGEPRECGHRPGDGDPVAPGDRDRHGADRHAALRQHQDRHRGGDAVFAAAVHGDVDRER